MLRPSGATGGMLLRGILMVLALTAWSSSAQAQNGATFVSQSVPAYMKAGQTYSVSVTLRNSGTTTWVATSNYNLGSQNPQDNSIWSLQRVAPVAPVAPGAQQTFTFNVIAPTTTGSYNFQWRMVQDFVEWFGDLTPNVAVTVQPFNAAAFVSQSVPANMVAGQTYNVSVTMKNTGLTTWTAAGKYNLGTQNPIDNFNWVVQRVPVPGNVAPGQQQTFSFQVTAPAGGGTTNFQWRMVQEFVEWFGATSTNVAVAIPVTPAPTATLSTPGNGAQIPATGATVAVPVTGTAGSSGSTTLSKVEVLDGATVLATLGGSTTINTSVTLALGPHALQLRSTDSAGKQGLSAVSNVTVVKAVNAATFVSQSVPAAMVAGQSYNVSLTMKNTGNTTWTTANKYYLGSQNPYDNYTWLGSANRLTLPVAVAPGQQQTFSFTVKAPATAGNYNFQWRMVQEFVEWFGDLAPNVAVAVTDITLPTVTLTGPANNASFPAGGSNASVTVTGTAAATGSATLSKVEILDGATVLTTLGSSGVINASVSLAVGPHALQLRVTDSLGKQGLSAVANITVTAALANGAQFVSQTVPATMVAGQAYTVTVVMKNSGASTWIASNQFRLGSQSPFDNTVFGIQRVELPSSVAPGAQASFSLSLKAPAAPGNYVFQWRMVEEFVEWFGQQTPAVTVAVTGSTVGSVSYTYDTLGRVHTATYASGAVVTYNYDAAGNRTSTVTSGAH
ncbi:MAG: NBR1-Ig-like domain-containing protein [Pseudomonadota bacterium]